MSENTGAMASDAATLTAALPAVLNLADDQASPIELGYFELDESGQLRKRDEKAPLAFTFRFHGLRFQAEVEVGAERQVRLTVPLGKMPFTAEAPTLRRHLRELVKLSRSRREGCVLLSAAQDLVFQAEAQPPTPFTPVSVMATVVSLLLKSQPLLDSIADLTSGLRCKPA